MLEFCCDYLRYGSLNSIHIALAVDVARHVFSNTFKKHVPRIFNIQTFETPSFYFLPEPPKATYALMGPATILVPQGYKVASHLASPVRYNTICI